MIKVTIEIIPGGEVTKKFTTGVIIIANDGTGTIEEGNYYAAISHTGKFWKKRAEPYKVASVKGFNRSESVYELIKELLENMRTPTNAEQEHFDSTDN